MEDRFIKGWLLRKSQECLKSVRYSIYLKAVEGGTDLIPKPVQATVLKPSSWRLFAGQELTL